MAYLFTNSWILCSELMRRGERERGIERESGCVLCVV